MDTSFKSPLFDLPVPLIALEADNKALCAYTTDGIHFTISRLNSTGGAEAPLLLGDGPQSITAATTNAASINVVKPLANGQILVGGTFSHFNKVARKLLVRLNHDGSVDPAFNSSNGFVGNDVSRIEVIAGNKLFVSGKFSKFGSSSRNIGLVRLNEDGTLDPSFVDGTISFGANVTGFSLQTDGKPVINAAYANATFQPTMQVYRLNANGGLDASFTQGSGTAVSSVVIQHSLLPSGQILVSGGSATYNGVAVNTALFRLNANGAIDTAFPGVTLKLANGGGLIGRFLPTPDGSVYFSGAFDAVNDQARHGLSRLKADGSWDPAFVPAVYVSPSPGALALQPDGKLLVCTAAVTEGVTKYQIVRLNGAGAAPPEGPRLENLIFLAGDTNQIHVSGAFSSVVVLGSGDLTSWQPIATNNIEGGAVSFADLPRPQFLARFFRLIGLP